MSVKQVGFQVLRASQAQLGGAKDIVVSTVLSLDREGMKVIRNFQGGFMFLGAEVAGMDNETTVNFTALCRWLRSGLLRCQA